MRNLFKLNAETNEMCYRQTDKRPENAILQYNIVFIYSYEKKETLENKLKYYICLNIT